MATRQKFKKIALKKKNWTVLVFGVFDLLHDGHRHFLAAAHAFGDTLVATVARDDTVRTLKGVYPVQPLRTRLSVLQKSRLVDYVFTGDRTPHSWRVVRKVRPDVIALGYDQDELAAALAKAKHNFRFDVKIVRVSAHGPKRFHSRIIRKKLSPPENTLPGQM